MSRHEIVRVRREPQRRALDVRYVEQLTPNMLRLHFTGDLGSFDSLAFDDHIKIFLGPPPAGGGRPQMRDFTPRAFDTAAQTIVIDFALHGSGPAVEWARQARAGDTLAIGGPRGSSVIPDDFDWYWLIGDESSLPAIGRRLEELRPDVTVTTFVVVGDAADAQEITTRATWASHWPVRTPGTSDWAALGETMAGMHLPAGEGFIWIAGEAALARAARDHVRGALGHPSEWIKASGYWQRGAADTHGRIDD